MDLASRNRRRAGQRYILGAPVPGEYLSEFVHVVVLMARRMRQVAESQLACWPT